MRPAEDLQLQHECEAFFRYLCGPELEPYVLTKYCEAHRKVAAYTPSGGFDQFLVEFAARGPVSTRMADSYARFFAPRSTLRRKLILLLAIMESSSMASKFLDTVDTQNKFLLSGKFLARGFASAVSLAAGTLLLFPCRLAEGLVLRRKR